MSTVWQCGRFEFNLDRPLLMGVVNVTPDSFSDGGQHAHADAAIQHAHQLIEEGAQIIDIGGESTRPGAQAVPLEEELSRIMPVLESLRDAGVALSVDTCKADVMRMALDLGADVINDVTGFASEASRAVVAAHSTCGACVMHMQGEPRTMQAAPAYSDLVLEVMQFLRDRTAALIDEGVAARRIAIDPGFGFGKSVAHNYTLLRELHQFVGLGFPVLAGLSRKSMIGAVTGRAVNDRLAGSLAGALSAVARGARILRVHDVAATRDALEVWLAVESGPRETK
jgi:dihydropteroate synthase